MSKRKLMFPFILSLIVTTFGVISLSYSDQKKIKLGSNHLSQEKSPYLLQHKDNPVWWFAWGEEAFKAAKEEDKPIFLSIGYATCHWCHVMEHESFEDKEVADFLNKHFISIKVDREELPDIDQVYMRVVQGMTGHGGWPMTVIMTSDKKPFFGGTYFPKTTVLKILTQLATAWEGDRENVEESAQKIVDHFKNTNSFQSDNALINDTLLVKALSEAKEDFDETNGGFGNAPKFPPSTRLQLLLRIHKRNGDKQALAITEKTLRAMAYGGIYDHLGGGFARYSTDEKWLIPHFEKMLYDNALLSSTYLDAFLVTKNSLYLSVATETLNYVLRDMTSKEGGFYSAEDADSEGVEGKFYAWSDKELHSLLSKDEYAALTKIYTISGTGNFEGGLNVFALKDSADWSSKSVTPLKEIQMKLFDTRAKRKRPLLDDKVLTSWNGLMIDSMAKGYRVTKDKKYLNAAQNAANFIHSNLWNNRKLFRRYRDGEVKHDAVLDDYVYLIKGLVSLYQSDFDQKWINWAKDLQEEQNSIFWDEKDGGYWYSKSDLIFRLKDFYDHAEPNPNGYAALNLIALSDFFVNIQYKERARKIIETTAISLTKHPQAFSTLLHAYDNLSDRSKEVAIIYPVINPKASESGLDEIFKSLWSEFLPNVTISSGSEADALPLLKGRPTLDKKITFYVCEDGTCKLPTTDLQKLMELVLEIKPISAKNTAAN